ncbi:MAG: hypothetical protein QXO71_07875 [Candidatus Jordarchaeaceae archaeon]
MDDAPQEVHESLPAFRPDGLIGLNPLIEPTSANHELKGGCTLRTLAANASWCPKSDLKLTAPKAKILLKYPYKSYLCGTSDCGRGPPYQRPSEAG